MHPHLLGKKLRKYPKRRDVGRRATPELVQDASQVPRVGARPGAVRQRSNAAVSMPSLGGSGWWSTPGAERSRDGGYRNLFWYKVGLINRQPGVTTLLSWGWKHSTDCFGDNIGPPCVNHTENVYNIMQFDLEPIGTTSPSGGRKFHPSNWLYLAEGQANFSSTIQMGKLFSLFWVLATHYHPDIYCPNQWWGIMHLNGEEAADVLSSSSGTCRI